MSHDYFIGVDALGAESKSIAKPDPKATDAGNKAVAAGQRLSKKMPRIGKKLISAGQRLLAKASKAAIDKAAVTTKKADATKAKSKAATAPKPTADAKSRVAAPSTPTATMAKSRVATPAPVPAAVPMTAASQVATPTVAPVVQRAATTVARPTAPTATRLTRMTSVRGLGDFGLQAAAGLSAESTALYAYTDMAWSLEPVVDLRDQLDAKGLTTIADQGQALLERGDAIDFSTTDGTSTAQGIASEAKRWASSARSALAGAPAQPITPSPEDLLNQGMDPYAGAFGGGGGGFDGGGGGEDPFADYGSDFDPNAAMDAATEGGDAGMPEGFEQDFSDGSVTEEPTSDALLEQEFLESQAQEGAAEETSVEEEPKPVTFTSPFQKVSDEKWTEFVNAMRTAELGDVSDSNALGAFEMKMRRLGDLGLVKNLRCVRSPDTNRLIWEGDFVSPMTAKRFLSDPDAQYRAFSDSMRDYRKRIKKREIPWPEGGLVDGTTFSGVLAILHRAGPKGIANFADPEKRFPETEELYNKVNGIF